MLVRDDGSTLGTVGGGLLEYETVCRAKAALATRRSELFVFNLSGDDVAGTDMICGGSGEIWLQYLPAESEDILAVFETAAASLASREKACLVTGLDSESSWLSGRMGLWLGDGRTVGDLKDSWGLTMSLFSDPEIRAAGAITMPGGRLLLEPLLREPMVYVFGAGHVSQHVAKLCESVGFRSVVLDDRAEFACRERFTPSTGIILLDSFDDWPGVELDRESYVLIMTRGHLHDKTVLARALLSPAGYIGMIGSRRKRDMIYEALRDEGYGADDLARVHSPVGLEIGAETPAEIAVSIVAQLIRERSVRTR